MVVADDIQALRHLALLGGLDGQVRISSQRLGDLLGTSAQTASRRLIALEDQMLITRTVRADGQFVTITRHGEDILKEEYAQLCQIFEERSGEYLLEGTLIDGLGEGAYYVSLPGYVSQFKELLGFEPYPGTFNLRLASPAIEMRKKIDTHGWKRVDGFTDHERTYGGCRVLACSIENISCAIIVPGRSHYPEDIIEIIAPVRLREKLGLSTKDNVCVTVHYDD